MAKSKKKTKTPTSTTRTTRSRAQATEKRKEKSLQANNQQEKEPITIDNDPADTDEVQLVVSPRGDKDAKSQSSGSGTHESPAVNNKTKSYAQVVTTTTATPTIKNTHDKLNTFLIAKEFNDHPERYTKDNDLIFLADTTANEAEDDATAPINNLSTMRRQRFKVNIAIPKADTGVTREQAPQIAIEKLNAMLQVLSNKHKGIAFIPWKLDTNAEISPKDIFETIPSTDYNFCEKNIYGFNRFASPGSFLKLRAHIAYPESIPLASILETTSSFFISREQRFEIAASDADQPLSAGTLTGSVQDMSTSNDFYHIFKSLFNLQDLGLTWEFPSNSGQVKYSPKMCKIHIEIHLNDQSKLSDMEQFFNNSSSLLSRNFLGTPMTLVPVQDRNLAQEVQDRIVKHCNIQGDLGKGLESTVQHGFAVNNWYDKEKEITLHQKLMSMKSITEKVVGHGKNQRKFYGRLFYAIIYSKTTRKTTFYYLPSNRKEARSVALGLALVIKDEFGVDPRFYCSGDKVQEAEEGHWDKATRTFLTKFEKEDEDRLAIMKESLEAKPAAKEYISKAHARAVATEKEDDIDEDTVLTKGSANPQRVEKTQEVVQIESPDGSLSSLSNSTRESKAKRYATEQVKEARKEFVKCQALMQSQLLEKDTAVMEKDTQIADLMAKLAKFQSQQPETVQVLPNSEVASDLSQKTPEDVVMSNNGEIDKDNGSKMSEDSEKNNNEDEKEEKDEDNESKDGRPSYMEIDTGAFQSPARNRKGEKKPTYRAGDRSNADEHYSKRTAVSILVNEETQDPTLIALPPETVQLQNNSEQNSNSPHGSTGGGKVT